MEFRPCIDIHNGKVKQIVGGSLKDSGDQAQENFVSEQDAAFYAALYQKNKLKGGHIILLNSYDSPYYEETRKQALAALQAYPGGLQVGGGITPENAGDYLNAGCLYDRSDRDGVRKHLHRSGVCADAGADVKGIRFGQPVVRFPAAL